MEKLNPHRNSSPFSFQSEEYSPPTILEPSSLTASNFTRGNNHNVGGCRPPQAMIPPTVTLNSLDSGDSFSNSLGSSSFSTVQGGEGVSNSAASTGGDNHHAHQHLVSHSSSVSSDSYLGNSGLCPPTEQEIIGGSHSPGQHHFHLMTLPPEDDEGDTEEGGRKGSQRPSLIGHADCAALQPSAAWSHRARRESTIQGILTDKKAASALLQADAPQVSGKGSWMKQANQMLLQRMAKFSEEDRQKLQDEVDQSRKALVEQNILAKPAEEGRFLKTRLQSFRLIRSRLERNNAAAGNHSSILDVNSFKATYWSYQKTALRQPILLLSQDCLDKTAMKMFSSLLVYSHLELTEESSLEPLRIVQSILKKCLENGDLSDEFFMQIIKQTTESSECEESVKLANWRAMCVACGLIFPNHEVILRYLRAHLKKYAIDNSLEEGRYATFSQKCLARTLEKSVRKFPISIKELKSLTFRKLPQIEIHLLNGSHCSVEFHPQSTIEDVLRIARVKLGMKSEAVGWAIMEAVGQRERCANHSDFLGDVLYRWEIYGMNFPHESPLKLLLKKRLFVTPMFNAQDEVEVELLGHQCIANIFEGRIPLIEDNALRLCALRSVAEEGDILASMRILPRTWRERILTDMVGDVATEYQGLSQHELHLEFIEICQQWPLFGSFMCDVSQQYSVHLPLNITLVVNETGFQLTSALPTGGYEVLATYSYSQIISFYTESRSILVVVVKNQRTEKLIFRSRQTTQIIFLLRDYMIHLKLLVDPCCGGRKSSDIRDGNISQIKPSKSLESGCNNDPVTVSNPGNHLNSKNSVSRSRSLPRTVESEVHKQLTVPIEVSNDTNGGNGDNDDSTIIVKSVNEDENCFHLTLNLVNSPPKQITLAPTSGPKPPLSINNSFRPIRTDRLNSGTSDEGFHTGEKDAVTSFMDNSLSNTKSSLELLQSLSSPSEVFVSDNAESISRQLSDDPTAILGDFVGFTFRNPTGKLETSL